MITPHSQPVRSRTGSLYFMAHQHAFTHVPKRPPYVRAARAGGESSRPQFLSKLPIGHPAQLMRMPRLERLLHPAQLVVQHIERALLACVRLEH